VEDRFGLHLGDDRLERLQLDDVELSQLCLRGHASGVARGEIVDHGDGVAAREQRVDDM
jgi:hypothetical protein